MKRILIIMLALGLAINLNAQNVKIGYTNADYVLSLMPESKEVQSQIQAYEKQFSNTIQQKVQTFQQKVAEYQQNAPTMTDQVRTDKEMELQAEQQSLQKFQQDAEQSIMRKQQELYEPLYEKIQNAIDKVAEENGFTHIVRAEAMLYIADEDNGNISDMVLRKLGVEPPVDDAE
ncbi:OmpH family outer membrane protein [Marivirga atlantica]|jgi:outer membrane protein|uniref:OmpH family outer membrane protein n=1 Tax=Marivirga atlantica TaxID=1548457 RepID=A0A937DFL6_9BACT|nr:OmpH family outer membrane protein [Marivirga atlantica]MBL0763803.1 OmpH family outer membrane protein [Marivirga atlantica]